MSYNLSLIFVAVDMTVLASLEPRSLDSPATNPELSEGETDRRDEEQALPPASSSAPFALGGRQSSGSEETELQTRSNTAVGTSSNFIKRKTSQLLEAISPARLGDAPISPKLAELIDAFYKSAMYAQLQMEIAEVEVRDDAQAALPDVALENSLTRGRQRASWGTQFRILSGRAFKNLYRDPALLATHYAAAIVVASAYPAFVRLFMSLTRRTQSSAASCSTTRATTSAGSRTGSACSSSRSRSSGSRASRA